MFSEDEDFNPKASSKLASLFSSPRQSNPAEHSFDIKKSGQPSAVSYLSGPRSEPPVANNPNSGSSASTSGSSSSLKLITVKVVQAFIFKDNKYDSYGKLAAALLGNDSIKHYQIILYRNKNDHITKSFISGGYWFGVQGNNYASFYDHKNVVWTVTFDTTSDFVEFCTEVALAKWICSLHENKTVVQDVITSSTGKSIKQYDNVKLNYVIWPLDDQYRPLKDCVVNGSNNFYLSLNDEWEKCLIDVMENSRRILVIPQLHAGLWEKIVGKNCNHGVLLDVTVELAIDHQQPYDLKKLQNFDIVLPKLPSNDDEVSITKTVKKNSDTLSESSLENVAPKKSDLISRMERLGKATLPMMGAGIPTAVDSDDTEEDTSSGYSAPTNRNVNKVKQTQKVKHKPVQPSVLHFPQQPVVPNYSQQQLLPNAMVGYPGLTAFTPVAVSPVIDVQLPILLSEIRTHNSELRMGLNSVTDKVDRVIDKIQMGPTHKVLQKVESINEEIMNQFSYLNALNDELRKSLLTESNIDLIESTGIVENEYENENVDELQKENDKLLNSLVESRNLIEDLQLKILSCEAEKNEFEDQLSTEHQATAELREELIKIAVGSRNEFVDQLTETFKLSLQNLSVKVHSLQKSLDESNLTFGNINPSSSLNSDIEADIMKVRENMNNLYKFLKLQFKPDTSYSSADVHDKISSMLRAYC